MKKFFLCLAAISIALAGSAAIYVNMYTTPVTVTGSTTTPKYHYMDAENDGIDDVRFRIEYEFGSYEITFRAHNGQSYYAEYINSPWEGIAYNCGASFGAGGNWIGVSDDLLLAIEDGDAQFDGKGPRYLAVRKWVQTTPDNGYIYGWVKLECAQDASQFTVYGFAYDDALIIYNPTIKAGQGECFGATSNAELELPAQSVIARDGKLRINYHQPLSLRLFDVAGRKLMERQFEGGAEEFDLPRVSGLFFVQISDGLKPKTIKLLL